MAINSVQKHCFVVLHVKLQMKIRLETFHWYLELLYTAFTLTPLPNQLDLLKKNLYPSNKCLIYRPDLNFQSCVLCGMLFLWDYKVTGLFKVMK